MSEFDNYIYRRAFVGFIWASVKMALVMTVVYFIFKDVK